MIDALSQFRDAIRAAELEPPKVIEPGKLHRFSGIGKRNGNITAWCKLFDDGLEGCFGDWSSGIFKHWYAKGYPYTTTEQSDFKRQLIEAQEQAANSLIEPNNMVIRDCPKCCSCSAPVCPLDDGCLETVHLEGERICYYMREAVKQDSEATFQALSLEELFKRVTRVLPSIIEEYGPLRRGLNSAGKTGSKMAAFKKKAPAATGAKSANQNLVHENYGNTKR